MVSVGPRECPGAFRCPSGGTCFAERARAAAAAADVVVVNTHLYGAHLASGGAVLPEHEVVVFDEAHEVEEVMTASPRRRGHAGAVPGPGRHGPDRRRAPTAPTGSPSVADLAAPLEAALRPPGGHPGAGRPAPPAPSPRAASGGGRHRRRPTTSSSPACWSWPRPASSGCRTCCARDPRPTAVPRARRATGPGPAAPPAIWPATWRGSPPGAPTRWPGWTARPGPRCCASPPSTSGRRWPPSCGTR